MGRNSFCTFFFHSHFTTFFKFGIIPNMGFYVGSALKYLSSICLNSKELFKGKKLPGGMELAWFTFKWTGKKEYKVEPKSSSMRFSEDYGLLF